MKAIAYYNENDPKAAAWLRKLITQGLIAPGDVDERSILEVRPHELTRYTQQHFFAGIGGWSLALRLAGWADERPVRTGSCPCQPFSAAGKGLAEADERHLWPAFRDLITFGEATVTFGEQVASALGRQWLAGVRADLEALGYGVGGADLCAAGVGAPHIRQRLYWVAVPGHGKRGRPSKQKPGCEDASEWDQKAIQLKRRGTAGGVAVAEGCERDRCIGDGDAPGRRGLANGGAARGVEHAASDGREQRRAESSGRGVAGGCGVGRMGDADDSRSQGRGCAELRECSDERSARPAGGAGGFWSEFDLVPCADGKARRVEPGSFPLVTGLPRGVVPSGDPSISEAQASGEARVARLRGYGNAIVPQLAAQFIIAAMECAAIQS